MNAPHPQTLSDPAAGASPVMAQYFEAKSRQPDALVFFRMGDFYELFFEDAQKAAAALGITLTARGQHAGQPIPMAGVPAHAMEAYLAKLIRAGFKVAVCEQMENPAEARKRGSKSVVRRSPRREQASAATRRTPASIGCPARCGASGSTIPRRMSRSRCGS